MLRYESLSENMEKRIREDAAGGGRRSFAFDESMVLRRHDNPRDRANVWRTAFIHDIDKILHCPYYNRYADKTQVFSFYKNDDITRRALHVQLVSRIARTIGKALGLNLDLIEAIALGHDIGHTPFGHAGERYLDEIFFSHTGRHFSHNIHSVRVLDSIYPYNISLQTLSGIASHDGELELSEYRPRALSSFEEFDELMESCYTDKNNIKHLVPSTLEGCVMRISDIIAYLGKDRQDAERANIISTDKFEPCAIGRHNAEIINNLIVNIIENSYGHDYIKLDEVHFNALAKAKAENYEKIYYSKEVSSIQKEMIAPMFEGLYDRLKLDLENTKKSSPIFTQHIEYINNARRYYSVEDYLETDNNQIIIDYIASMTDDYLVELYDYFYPGKSNIKYYAYFEK